MSGSSEERPRVLLAESQPGQLVQQTTDLSKAAMTALVKGLLDDYQYMIEQRPWRDKERRLHELREVRTIFKLMMDVNLVLRQQNDPDLLARANQQVDAAERRARDAEESLGRVRREKVELIQETNKAAAKHERDMASLRGQVKRRDRVIAKVGQRLREARAKLRETQLGRTMSNERVSALEAFVEGVGRAVTELGQKINVGNVPFDLSQPVDQTEEVALLRQQLRTTQSLVDELRRKHQVYGPVRRRPPVGEIELTLTPEDQERLVNVLNEARERRRVAGEQQAEQAAQEQARAPRVPAEQQQRPEAPATTGGAEGTSQKEAGPVLRSGTLDIGGFRRDW